MASHDHAAELERAGANISGWWSSVAFLARKYPLGAIGALIMVLFLLTALLAGVTGLDPFSTSAKSSLARPGGEHVLGADFMGRDVFARIVYGARISLAVAVGATTLGCLIGVTIGLMSGFFGGWFDLLVQRLIDIMQSLPLLVMALVMAASLGPSLTNTIIAIAIPLVPSVARVIRSNTLSLREMPYVDAARASGYGHGRIILRHMLPNVMAPILIMATAFLGEAILLEASLSFLGLGVQEPTAAWGLMLRGAAVQFAESAPWMAIFPGLAISLAVFGFNLFGDSLRDALDPRLRTQ